MGQTRVSRDRYHLAIYQQPPPFGQQLGAQEPDETTTTEVLSDECLA